MKPKFVYFDVGGVAILDFSGTNKWQELKKELGIPAQKEQEFISFWEQYEAEVCIGKDLESLIPLIKKKFNSRVPNGYSFLIDGFVNRFTVNGSIWPVIRRIHKQCAVGLLTNMYPGMLTAIKGRGLLPETIWDVIIDSSIAGIKKPNPGIFKLAEERADAKGGEILFVDNGPENVTTAKTLGWQTFLYDPASPEDSSSKLLEFYKKL